MKNQDVFDPQEPFPLLSEENYSYVSAQEHAEQVDAWLGLRTEQTEASLIKPDTDINQQLWTELPVRSLLTPYIEIRLILSLLNIQSNSHLVDLGAGYGRIGFVIAEHYPGVHFTGYELVRERVNEAQRVFTGRKKYQNITLVWADLSAPEFHLQSADYYFIYDFGSCQAVEKSLNDLKRIAQNRAIAVVGRGRMSRHLIESGQPWLSQVVEPEHHMNFSIYRSHHT